METRSSLKPIEYIVAENSNEKGFTIIRILDGRNYAVFTYVSFGDIIEASMMHFDNEHELNNLVRKMKYNYKSLVSVNYNVFQKYYEIYKNHVNTFSIEPAVKNNNIAKKIANVIYKSAAIF